MEKGLITLGPFLSKEYLWISIVVTLGSDYRKLSSFLIERIPDLTRRGFVPLSPTLVVTLGQDYKKVEAMSEGIVVG